VSQPEELKRTAGQLYEDCVPDTLDLADRAALAIQGITGVTDPDWHYFAHFGAKLTRKPPILYHDLVSDIYGSQEKFLEALPLLHLMTPYNEKEDIEKGMLQGIVDKTRNGILWADMEDGKWIDEDWIRKRYGNTTLPIHDGRMAAAAAAWYLYTQDPKWKKMAEDKIDAWYSRVVRKGDDMMYLPGGVRGHPQYIEGRGWRSDDFDNLPPREDLTIEPNGTGVAYHGWFIMAMAQCFHFLGNEKAREMAEKMTRYTLSRKDVYDQFGHYKTRRDLKPEEYEPNIYGGHFHIALYGLLGPLEYARLTHDQAAMQYIRGIYEFSRSTGYPPIGWFPEYHSLDTRCETCQLSDMIAMAVKLSKAGIGDYWEDVDQYVRNQFVENQLTSTDWLDRIPKKYVHEEPVRYDRGETDFHVPERCLGGFSGWAAPNDWLALETGAWGIQQCCTGNGSRALYYAWEGIIQYKDETAQVNLLLNRASPWMDIDSYLPYEGKVVLKNKTARNVAVRIPQWVDKKDVRCQAAHAVQADGQSQGQGQAGTAFIWAGQYIVLSGLKPHDQVTITFPMAEHSATFKLDTGEYTVTFKGNTVTGIDPKGIACPLYEREYYKQNEAPMKKVTRYVAPLVLDW
jgi:hypothetical protein